MRALCCWNVLTVMQVRVLSYVVLLQWLNKLRDYYETQQILTIVLK